ncbi:hypothetical protein RJB91_00310 [Staphylococcus epidermidis]|nr:hypothetical protein [Staphylococcus epidermidis]
MKERTYIDLIEQQSQSLDRMVENGQLKNRQNRLNRQWTISGYILA